MAALDAGEVLWPEADAVVTLPAVGAAIEPVRSFVFSPMAASIGLKWWRDGGLISGGFRVPRLWGAVARTYGWAGPGFPSGRGLDRLAEGQATSRVMDGRTWSSSAPAGGLVQSHSWYPCQAARTLRAVRARVRRRRMLRSLPWPLASRSRTAASAGSGLGFRRRTSGVGSL